MRKVERVPDFVGRAEHLRLLDEALGCALEGTPQVVLVTGEAGVGKSRLVDHWLARLPWRALCRVRADRDEMAVEFGTAHRVLAQQAAASPVSPVDHPASRRTQPLGLVDVGLALLARFTESLPDLPARVVFLDDIHWADEASLTALGFAARRLGHDKVLLVAAARDPHPTAAAGGLARLASSPTGHHLHVEGLTLEQTGHLASAVAGKRLDPVTLRALHEATRGNPLWVQSVADRLPSLGVDPEGALPAGSTLMAAVRDRVEGCAPDSRNLLGALAVLAGEQTVGRVAELAGVSDVWSALDGALASGLVSCSGVPPTLTVTFTHPVMAPAVESSLSYEQRGALHQAAATSAGTRGEQLRHLVACAAGPDPELAGDVLAYGRRLADGGSLLEASGWIHRAAALIDAPARRDELVLEAAHTALAGGFPGIALSLLEEGPKPPSGYRDYLTASVAWLHGRHVEARSGALAAAESDDDRARAGAAFLMSQIELVNEDGAEAARWAELATASGGPLDREQAKAAWGAALLLGGSPERTLELFGPPNDEPAPSKITQEAMRGLALIHLDRPDEARVAFTAAARAARRHNQYYLAEVTLANFGMLENRCGNWPDATLYLNQALAYAETLEGHWGLAVIHALSAFVPAVRGEQDVARKHVEQAFSAGPQGGRSGRVYANVAALQVAHADGDTAAVLEVGEWLAQRPRASGAWLPGVFQWAGRYAEALVDTGALTAALRLSRSLTAIAEPTRRPAGVAEARRVAGIVALASGRIEDAGARFREAASLYARSAMPLEAALTQLRAGATLRLLGQARSASVLLKDAHATFEDLGATAYVASAGRELAACAGLAPRRPLAPGTSFTPSSPGEALTSQESVVARLVAQGLTNREVAGQMLLSVRTVEFHLASIYRKLRIRSRTQLVAHQLGAPVHRG